MSPKIIHGYGHCYSFSELAEETGITTEQMVSLIAKTGVPTIQSSKGEIFVRVPLVGPLRVAASKMRFDLHNSALAKTAELLIGSTRITIPVDEWVPLMDALKQMKWPESVWYDYCTKKLTRDITSASFYKYEDGQAWVLQSHVQSVLDNKVPLSELARIRTRQQK
jgi:hypothetical protein